MRRTDREVTDREKQMEILHVCKVARIGIQDGKGVYVVPVNFGLVIETDKLTMYVHGAKEGKKLDLIKENPYVGFEMDCKDELVEGKVACQYSYYYASIIGSGKASVVEDQEEKCKALAAIMKHQKSSKTSVRIRSLQMQLEFSKSKLMNIHASSMHKKVSVKCLLFN